MDGVSGGMGGMAESRYARGRFCRFVRCFFGASWRNRAWVNVGRTYAKEGLHVDAVCDGDFELRTVSERRTRLPTRSIDRQDVQGWGNGNGNELVHDN